MAHRTEFPVRFVEIDPYGHVNHAVYVTYLEVGRTDALAACGLGLAELADSGFQLVITGLEIRYRGAAVLGDTVAVETELSALRRASGTWAQRVLRVAPDGGDEEVLVTAEVSAGVTDRTGRPTRPPAWMMERMALLGGGREP